MTLTFVRHIFFSSCSTPPISYSSHTGGTSFTLIIESLDNKIYAEKCVYVCVCVMTLFKYKKYWLFTKSERANERTIIMMMVTVAFMVHHPCARAGTRDF